MGHGISEVAALAGYRVNLQDINEEFVQDGYAQIEWSLDKLADQDRIPEEKAESALDNVTPYVDIEAAVDDADFVTEVVDTEAFEERIHEFAADLAAGPPIAQKFTKRAMHRGWEDTDAGLEIEAQAFGHLMNTEDLMEGINAFMGDEDPEFEGK